MEAHDPHSLRDSWTGPWLGSQAPTHPVRTSCASLDGSLNAGAGSAGLEKHHLWPTEWHNRPGNPSTWGEAPGTRPKPHEAVGGRCCGRPPRPRPGRHCQLGAGPQAALAQWRCADPAAGTRSFQTVHGADRPELRLSRQPEHAPVLNDTHCLPSAKSGEARRTNDITNLVCMKKRKSPFGKLSNTGCPCFEWVTRRYTCGVSCHDSKLSPNLFVTRSQTFQFWAITRSPPLPSPQTPLDAPGPRQTGSSLPLSGRSTAAFLTRTRQVVPQNRAAGSAQSARHDNSTRGLKSARLRVRLV